MTSTIDTVRALFTYGIATVVVVGGGFMIFATRSEPASQDLRVIMAGFIGAALTFVFQQETQTRTARQTNTAQQAGAIAHANGLAGQAPPTP